MALNGGHSVQISACAGHVAVVLRHDHDERQDSILPDGDCQFVSDDDPNDHVIHFAAATPDYTAAAGGSGVAPVLLMLPEAAWECSRPVLRACCEEAHCARPPPGRPAMLVCLRTTVLIV